MGGLGPGVGGFEILVIGLVALLVVGPKDLPILMRRVGQMVGKARAMANEFRASFDEMARQSELDELRKEVEALRTGQGMYPLGAQADAAFKEINAGLTGPATPSVDPVALPEPVVTPAAAEWPDAPSPDPRPTAAAKPKAKRASPKTSAKPAARQTSAKAPASKPAAKTATKTTPAAKPKVTRKKAVEP
ncbi:Sec-independent protein translocase protein TatB [Brevundimonas sp. SORGH_AS_0993]|uniref:Sec-independent protein translocase protein TatB n=1 Tax=Brevundimonas sp. SORGH_AS_0993 TaxID=3041794 RepID=UPI002788FB8F|nr:Sec-independent protein translocase protein TatB [Brevundimonas sp. SORGH_AS_0993]MDQ1153490.1 sec-independent protein translocase protein TatB [Brevundimonas sp. SORGH_AS_0993]